MTARLERVLGGVSAQELAGADGRGPSRLVALPESTGEVAGLVHRAVREGKTLLPSGRGGWLHGGGWTRDADLVLSTRRMRKAIQYEPADLTATVGSGMTWSELDAMLRPNGQWFPVDPPGRTQGTLGALAACGGAGPLRGRYGGVKDNILGLEMVTGRGQPASLGGRVVKNVAGFDLTRLAIGSRGSLGVITALSLRLQPRSSRDITVVYASTWEEALDRARALRLAHIPVAQASVHSSRELPGGGARAFDAALSARILADKKEAARVEQLLGRAVGAAPDLVLRDEESERFHGRQTRTCDEAALSLAIHVLPSHAPKAVDVARRACARDDILLTVDALAGVVEVRLLGSRDDLSPAALSARASLLAKEAKALGGAVTVREAPFGPGKSWGRSSEGKRRVSRRLKEAFDPAGVFASRIP